MKQLFIILMILILSCVFCSFAKADLVEKTFAWDQIDYVKVNYWILYWGGVSGGPYDVGQFKIEKSMLENGEENPQAPVTIDYPA